MNQHIHEPEAITRLTKDLRLASTTMTDTEARFLVDAYYTMQGNRIRSNNQVRAMSEEPHGVIQWLANQDRILEDQIKAALDIYSNSHFVGRWARSNFGVGPVIAAGLIAHIDITKAPTAGHIWSFAGLNPKMVWEKGKKRPWNSELKVVCWKLGESFVKFSGHEDCFYGHIYAQRKVQEIEMNERLEFADQAKEILEKKNFRNDTVAKKYYNEGKLPPAHIHARAKRWAVKLFISHLHQIWYEHHYQTTAPVPYAFAHLGHVHRIDPPNHTMR